MVTLLPPTILMGMSLPLLVRGSVRAASTAGRTIGALYGVNVLGASAGALAAPQFCLDPGGDGGPSGVL